MQNATIPCRSRDLLPFLSVKYFSCHPSPPTILPSSLTSSYHLFLGLPLNLVIPKFIHNTLLGILLSSILCTCPNQHNLFNLIVSIIVGFLALMTNTIPKNTPHLSIVKCWYSVHVRQPFSPPPHCYNENKLLHRNSCLLQAQLSYVHHRACMQEYLSTVF